MWLGVATILSHKWLTINISFFLLTARPRRISAVIRLDGHLFLYFIKAQTQHWDESANSGFGSGGGNTGNCQKCSRTPIVHELDLKLWKIKNMPHEIIVICATVEKNVETMVSGLVNITNAQLFFFVFIWLLVIYDLEWSSPNLEWSYGDL